MPGVILLGDAQQGDLLSLLHFLLAYEECLKSRINELVLGSLNDVVIGGEAACTLTDFTQLELAARKICFELNSSKCKIVGHSKLTMDRDPITWN